MSNQRSILVTGATGFIGANLIPILLSQGFRVTCTSTNSEKAKALPWYEDVQFIPLNLENLNPSENYYNYFGRPDSMIHMAWPDIPNYRLLTHIEKALPTHYQFCKNMLQNGLKDITIAGTCMEYGIQNGCLSEADQANPNNPYAVAKYTLFKFIELLKTEWEFNFKWLRLFYTYGPGQHSSSLYSQLINAVESGKPIFHMSNGDQIRDFLPIEKMALFISKVAGQQLIDGIINICSNRPVTVKHLIEQILAEKGSSIELNTGYYPYSSLEAMYFWGNNQKLLKILNNE